MQFTQDALFPVAAIETEGYAQPEPDDSSITVEETAAEPEAEAA